jgi:hypothetical protein
MIQNALRHLGMMYHCLDQLPSAVSLVLSVRTLLVSPANTRYLRLPETALSLLLVKIYLGEDRSCSEQARIPFRSLCTRT